MAHYDIIIIGAGHNGLVCAAYLARAGRKVLVLEAADVAGGLAAAREFHPGYRTSVAHTLGHFSAKIAADLELASHGFDAEGPTLPTVGLGLERDHIVVTPGSLQGASDHDATAYQDYIGRMHRFADCLKPFWHKTMPRIGATGAVQLASFAQLGLRLRRLGRKEMREFMRVATLPVRDLMDENFDDELVKATLCWDGLIGANMAPRSPNSAVLSLLYRQAEESRGAHAIPSGGVPGLVTALAAAATSAGVELRCAAGVDRIIVEAGDHGPTTKGVQLADGQKIAAETVVSATDPQRTFIGLVGVEYLDIGFTNRIRRLRCAGKVAKLHLALDGEPEFTGFDKAAGRMLIAPEMDAIEFAFDAAKYGECPAEPVIEVVVPSLTDASLAPPGKHVLSAHVMYVPYALKGGWTDAERDRVCRQTIATLGRYSPGIHEQILHSEFLTPADIERDYRVTGGHWHHTEFAMDQMLMMRPTYGAAQYRTPIAGLYLCGAGCHPGGDLVGAAGHNAAHELLQ